MEYIYIIIPIYNVERYLRRCLDSILLQTFKDYELILVDDGSTDNSPVICDEYAKKNNRISVIHKVNGGLSSARNVGLNFIKDKSSGYVAFIDGDDWVDNDYLYTLLNLMNANNADIVCTGFIYNDNRNHIHYNIDKERSVRSLEATNLLLKDETIQSHAWSKLYKVDLWYNIRFDESVKFMEDQCTTYKVFYKAKNVFVSNYTGYHYRQDNNGSLMKTKMNNGKVVSGLKGYYYPCIYDGFSENDRIFLIHSLHNALINAFLMLIPHFKTRLATSEEVVFIKELKKYIKDNGLIKQYVPKGKNNVIKKRLYMFCPPLYPCLFRLAKLIK